MKLVILAEDEMLLEQLVARVAQYNLQPTLTKPTLKIAVEKGNAQFENVVCLVGATTEMGAAFAERFALQQTLARLRCRCVLAIPQLEETPLGRLAAYHQCRIVRWEDSDEQWIDTLHIAQYGYDALPEDMYRPLHPNILTSVEPMRTAK